MTEQKVDQFIASYSKYLPRDKILLVRERLLEISDEKYPVLFSASLKNTTDMLLISLFAGNFGADRFVLGDTGLGVLKLLTFGGCGIWTIVDWFLVGRRAKEYNYDRLMEIIQ